MADIALAQKEDFEHIYQLLVKNALWLKDICPQQWPMDWLESQKDELQQSVMKQQFYVLKLQNELIGVIELKQSPESLWGYEPTSSIYIHKLATDPLKKVKGIGEKLLKFAYELAVDYNKQKLRLDCVKINPFLKQYYLDAGFDLVGEAIDEDEPVWLLEKNIKKNKV